MDCGKVKSTTKYKEVLRLCGFWNLPGEVEDIILRMVFAIPKPTLNCGGYVVAKVKNVWRIASPNSECFMKDFVLENVENRARWWWYWSPVRPVCVWKPDYYDLSITQRGIIGLEKWVKTYGRRSGDQLALHNVMLIDRTSRRSAEWIGFRQWIQTHPVYQRHALISYTYITPPRSPQLLTHYWFKYELALAYPTLYGEGGWANQKL